MRAHSSDSQMEYVTLKLCQKENIFATEKINALQSLCPKGA